MLTSPYSVVYQYCRSDWKSKGYSRTLLIRFGKKKRKKECINRVNIQSEFTEKFVRLNCSSHLGNVKRCTTRRRRVLSRRGRHLEMCILVFVALASVRLCSSNLALVSSFIEQSVLVGSFDEPTRCESWQEMPTWRQTGRARAARRVVVFLLCSAKKQKLN